MAGTKRSNDRGSSNKQTKKKFKVSSGFLDPGTSGIYATCSRRHEKQAMQELGLLFEEKMNEIYSKELKKLTDLEDKENKESVNESKEELSIEDQIKQELSELKPKDKNSDVAARKKEPLNFIDLNCECVIFCKTRKPIVPEEFVTKIIKDLADPTNMKKRTRYIMKLTPVTNSCNATMEQFIILLNKVLAPHFHEGENAKKNITFAVDLTRRNFNTIERMDLINQIVKQVIQDGKYKHTVDLKSCDKLILVECFKNNIGVSVVNGDYTTKYKKYNVQQIFESKFKKQAEENDK